MFKNLLKRKEPFDYGEALRKLAAICKAKNEYDVILPSVFYNEKGEEYVVRFECAMKEYVKENTYFYAIRRDERLKGKNLEDLLSFVVAYVNYPDAFVNTPLNLPEGITMKIKNFKRVPNQYSISHKV